MGRRRKLVELRLAAGWTQLALALELGVRTYTVQRWESGQSKPEARLREPLAKAFGISAGELDELFQDDHRMDSKRPNSAPRPARRGSRLKGRRLKISRFVPFYVGEAVDDLERRLRQNIEVCGIKGETEVVHEGAFVVLILRDEILLGSAVDFLRSRREVHLSILRSSRLLLSGLRKNPNHPIFQDQLPGIDYVMSVHHLCSSPEAVDLGDILAMVNPSLVGMTDDPNQQPSSDQRAQESLLRIEIPEAFEDVRVINSKECRCYVSWANVVLLDPDEDSPFFRQLEGFETELQRLWYQLHLYDQFLNLTGVHTRDSIQSEINETRMRFASFCRIDPTGATCTNSLKEALVKTSKIDFIVDSLKDRMSML